MSTPSPKVLLAAKVYFVLVCVYFFYAMVREANEFVAADWPQRISPVEIGITVLILLMALCPMVGHFGFAWQRKLANRAFWRAFFVLDAVLWGAGLLMQFLVGVERDGRSENFELLIWAPQIVILFAYTYLSPHIWDRQAHDRGASLV